MAKKSLKKDTDVIVSICCITYNQDKYIKETLDGFLKQKTNYKYEIIIHDDASTDNTAQIIREYEQKYPDIIKPIYQTENQHSKGKKIFQSLFDISKAKYIAICEGDDYWNDEFKLQKQIDYMESHPDCGLCLHNGWILDDVTKKTKKMVPLCPSDKKFMKKDGIYNLGELTLLGFIPTASLCFRRCAISNPPKFFYKTKIGDLPMRLLAANYGYAYYMDDAMCVYRRNTGISMCDAFEKANVDKKIADLKHVVWIIDEFDKFSNFKYTKELDIFKKFYDIKIYGLTKEYSKMKDKEHKKYYKMLGFKFRFKNFLNINFPFVVKFIKNIKQYLISKKIIAKWI